MSAADRFGRFPRTPGEAAAAVPWLLGYHPAKNQLGWISANRGRITAVGVGDLERATSAGWVWRFTSEMNAQPASRIVVVGPPDSGPMLEEFVKRAGAGEGPHVQCFERDGERMREFQDGQPGPYRSAPAPPIEILTSGRPAPAANRHELEARYAVTPGPDGVGGAVELSHLDKVVLDRLGPSERHRAALAGLDHLVAPRAQTTPRDIARLSYLMTDPIVREAVLADAVTDPSRVAALVEAHRRAHPVEGSELRGAAAVAVYATAPRPQVAALIAEQAPDSVLATRVAALAVDRVPGAHVYTFTTAPDAHQRLQSAEDQWEQTAPLPSTLQELRERLQQLPDLQPPAPGQQLPDIGPTGPDQGPTLR